MSERHVPGDRLSAFLDDELGDVDAYRAAHHLADCDLCRAELAALRVTRDALRALPPLRAPELTPEVPSPARQPAGVGRRVKLVVVVCAVPALIGAGAYVAGGDGGEVEPPPKPSLVEHPGRTGGPVSTVVGEGDG